MVVEGDGAGWRAGAHAPDRPSDPTRRKAKPPNKRDRSHTAAVPCKRQPRRWTASDCDGPSHPSRAPRSSLGPRPPRARPGAHGSPRSLCVGQGRLHGFRVADSPPKIGIAGSASAGVVRKSVPFAGTGGQRPQQAEHLTFCRPAEGLRFGRTRIDLQTGRFSWSGRRAARGESGVSPTRRRRTSRLRMQERPANASLFRSG